MLDIFFKSNIPAAASKSTESMIQSHIHVFFFSDYYAGNGKSDSTKYFNYKNYGIHVSSGAKIQAAESGGLNE